MLWAITRTVAVADFMIRRDESLHAHSEYLRSQRDILVLSGGTTTDDGVEIIGSVLIVNVGSRDEAQAFIEGDPFQQAGLFSEPVITRMRKSQWNPQSAEGA